MALLVDIQGLSTRAADEAIDYLFKAIGDGGGEGVDIWAPHENGLIRRLVELFTRRGLARIDKVRDELWAWLNDERHKPGAEPIARPGYMYRWGADELDLARMYLEALPQGSWLLEDYGILVDYLVQRYMPAGEMRAEAEWLSVRSTLMGKVQANVDKLTEGGVDALAAAMPLTVIEAVDMFAPSDALRLTMEYAAERSMQSVMSVPEAARSRIRAVLVEHERRVMQGDNSGPDLESALFDKFSTLNVDWRRIAVTEAGEAANNGFLSSLQPGDRVKRIEMYGGVCGHCKALNGKVFTLVAPSAADKDGDAQVWVGKTNVGRSAAPRKRTETGMVDRSGAERWWAAAGTQHPHCRGRWEKTTPTMKSGDAKFDAWLAQYMETV